jgi:hypothetical protein
MAGEQLYRPVEPSKIEAVLARLQERPGELGHSHDRDPRAFHELGVFSPARLGILLGIVGYAEEDVFR